MIIDRQCVSTYAIRFAFQIGRLEAALEDVVQDRRGEVHDGRKENAAVDENVREAKGGEHCAYLNLFGPF